MRLLIVAACCLLNTSLSFHVDAQPRPARWYRSSKPIGIVSSTSQDSVVLTARGTRADSLQITLAFYIGREIVFHEDWDSSYELVDADSLLATPTRLNTFMRARLDSTLASVKRAPIDTATIRDVGDLKAYRSFVKRPAEQISFSYGYETTVVLAWDPQRRRVIVLLECC